MEGKEMETMDFRVLPQVSRTIEGNPSFSNADGALEPEPWGCRAVNKPETSPAFMAPVA